MRQEELEKMCIRDSLPPDREATTELLNAVGLVDLISPRGSSSLINYVRDHARVPVSYTHLTEMYGRRVRVFLHIDYHHTHRS